MDQKERTALRALQKMLKATDIWLASLLDGEGVQKSTPTPTPTIKQVSKYPPLREIQTRASACGADISEHMDFTKRPTNEAKEKMLAIIETAGGDIDFTQPTPTPQKNYPPLVDLKFQAASVGINVHNIIEKGKKPSNKQKDQILILIEDAKRKQATRVEKDEPDESETPEKPETPEEPETEED